MIVYITIGIFVLLLIISFLFINRQWLKRNDDLSFIRIFFNSNEWKEIKNKIDFNLIALIANENRKEIRKSEFMKSAILQILETKRNFTYNYTKELITELIIKDNLKDFKNESYRDNK